MQSSQYNCGHSRRGGGAGWKTAVCVCVWGGQAYSRLSTTHGHTYRRLQVGFGGVCRCMTAVGQMCATPYFYSRASELGPTKGLIQPGLIGGGLHSEVIAKLGSLFMECVEINDLLYYAHKRPRELWIWIFAVYTRLLADVILQSLCERSVWSRTWSVVC